MLPYGDVSVILLLPNVDYSAYGLPYVDLLIKQCYRAITLEPTSYDVRTAPHNVGNQFLTTTTTTTKVMTLTLKHPEMLPGIIEHGQHWPR